MCRSATAFERGGAARVLGRAGHDRDAVRPRFVVGPQSRGDVVRGAEGTDLVKELDGDGGGHLEAACTRAGALDEVEKAELAEHFAVSGRGQIDGQLGRQLALRRVAGIDRDGHPHRQARRDAPGRGSRGVDDRPDISDPGGRHQIEHDLVSVLRRHPRHRGAERTDRDSAVRQRISQPEALLCTICPA